MEGERERETTEKVRGHASKMLRSVPSTRVDPLIFRRLTREIVR